VATKKTSGAGRYVVLRDFGPNLAGDIIDLTDDAAADLLRDGMVAPVEEG
jgi:hypothetical protein